MASSQSLPELPADDLHEMAHVERLLRADDRVREPVVRVGRNGSKIHYNTWELNAHARGSVTADVCNEIAATAAWGLATVHDPKETEEGAVVSLLSVVHDDGGEVGD